MDEPKTPTANPRTVEHSETPTMNVPAARGRGRAWPFALLAVVLVAAVWAIRDEPPASAQAARGRGGVGAVPVVAVTASRGSIGVYVDGLGGGDAAGDGHRHEPCGRPTGRRALQGRRDRSQRRPSGRDRSPPVPGAAHAGRRPAGQGSGAARQRRTDLERYQDLVTQNAVPEQQLATQKALVAQYEGAIKTDQGAIDTAKLNLTYSRITAPITGRVGLRLVDPGNMVSASDANGLW